LTFFSDFRVMVLSLSLFWVHYTPQWLTMTRLFAELWKHYPGLPEGRGDHSGKRCPLNHGRRRVAVPAWSGGEGAGPVAAAFPPGGGTTIGCWEGRRAEVGGPGARQDCRPGPPRQIKGRLRTARKRPRPASDPAI